MHVQASYLLTTMVLAVSFIFYWLKCQEDNGGVHLCIYLVAGSLYHKLLLFTIWLYSSQDVGHCGHHLHLILVLVTPLCCLIHLLGSLILYKFHLLSFHVTHTRKRCHQCIHPFQPPMSQSWQENALLIFLISKGSWIKPQQIVQDLLQR